MRVQINKSMPSHTKGQVENICCSIINGVSNIFDDYSSKLVH